MPVSQGVRGDVSHSSESVAASAGEGDPRAWGRGPDSGGSDRVCEEPGPRELLCEPLSVGRIRLVTVFVPLESGV